MNELLQFFFFMKKSTANWTNTNKIKLTKVYLTKKKTKKKKYRMYTSSKKKNEHNGENWKAE
jgi:hypothetical protein